ncbi:hypothetical protein [Agarivorans sp. 1_MG-2023]|uniref:hypothetical protein n=1 Tax=Agarivorans sp. 1_MG-2023 TaxID=3062634 RepID=UPI0026E2A7E1|nr:hypothetical protein [Agarivorans sp. 1_MG-2023]MDO6764663.1 hypothetical protein [Agarivorans sp. 1_MG-2023]
MKQAVLLIIGVLALSGCNSQATPTGKACMGSRGGSLVEGLENQCKAGDAIATKEPTYYCDFNYAIAYNDYNSAMCIYSGKRKDERTAG